MDCSSRCSPGALCQSKCHACEAVCILPARDTEGYQPSGGQDDLYRPRFVRHRIESYAAIAADESWFCRMAAGVWNPCRSMSQVVLQSSRKGSVRSCASQYRLSWDEPIQGHAACK